jgi:hypothetical protein
VSWGPYVGQDVFIEWTDPADDWRYFRVVRVVDTTHGIAVLRGIDDPAGGRHDGDTFRALWREVRRIKLID